MEGWITFAASFITALFAFLGVALSNRSTRKVVVYRVDQLEKKVDKHNQVIERTYKLEQKVADMERLVIK